ncbi:hypothetical protein C3991_03496 [Escherichia coli]|nr:hypothetical protein C3991_03496 [Escherichia coli]
MMVSLIFNIKSYRKFTILKKPHVKNRENIYCPVFGEVHGKQSSALNKAPNTLIFFGGFIFIFN